MSLFIQFIVTIDEHKNGSTTRANAAFQKDKKQPYKSSQSENDNAIRFRSKNGMTAESFSACSLAWGKYIQVR